MMRKRLFTFNLYLISFLLPNGFEIIHKLFIYLKMKLYVLK